MVAENQASRSRGFTLVEIVLIIVILGVLAAVAIPKYIDFRNETRDSVARGILASLRSANNLVYQGRIVRNVQSSYNMATVVSSANISGVSSATSATRLTVTISGSTYVYRLTPDSGRAPTTLPAVTLIGKANW
jgi:MSHA pilin protein MshA